jgi:hypothetical protein
MHTLKKILKAFFSRGQGEGGDYSKLQFLLICIGSVALLLLELWLSGRK